jgi:hypothetical protein
MSDIHQELFDAEARVEQIKRQIAAGRCSETGHDWQSYGGCNAGCHDRCNCSVPVNLCTKCGDCDYGDNAEARAIRDECGGIDDL